MKFDIHVHSKYSSDGVMEPNFILKLAKKNNYDGIVITDHNSMEAYGHLDRNGLTIIKGEEVSSCCGHILAIDIEEFIPKGLSIEETIEKIKEQGGIAIAAHPYRFWSGLGEKNTSRNKFDAIEILNSRSFKKDNDKAKRLSYELKLPGTAGSDAHLEHEFGRAWVIVNNDLHKEIIKGEAKVGGYSRNFNDTIKYVTRSVSLWIERGFKKI
ncbi:MAG: CehA/McbA family metallohydrolase [Thermoplasmata archaeon]|nr:CehA/McbA family metallohydrolase [Thermoplasmata archaeon]